MHAIFFKAISITLVPKFSLVITCEDIFEMIKIPYIVLRRLQSLASPPSLQAERLSALSRNPVHFKGEFVKSNHVFEHVVGLKCQNCLVPC